jgi:hypothetical protein
MRYGLKPQPARDGIWLELTAQELESLNCLLDVGKLGTGNYDINRLIEEKVKFLAAKHLQKPLTIAGYEVKVDGRKITIGCLETTLDALYFIADTHNHSPKHPTFKVHDILACNEQLEYRRSYTTWPDFLNLVDELRKRYS